MGARFLLPTRVVLPCSATIGVASATTLMGRPTRATLSNWRRDAGLPLTIKNGRCRFFITADLQEWLERRGVICEREQDHGR